jgi:hypothetical protein
MKKRTDTGLPLLFQHLKGIWLNPTFELKRISGYDNFRNYLKWIIIYIILIEILNIIFLYFIPPLAQIPEVNLSPKFINFQRYSKIFTLIFWPTMYFAGGFITNWLCQKAKAKNKINNILISTAVLGLATNFPLYLLSTIFPKLNNLIFTVIYYSVSFWIYYLSVLNISFIYSITKKLALGVFLLTMIVGGIISFLTMSLLLYVS